jgi:putative transposase
MLVYWQLEGVRSVPEWLKDNWLRVRRGLGLEQSAKPVSKQAVSQRLADVPAVLFAELFEFVKQACQESGAPLRRLLPPTVRAVKVIDSTVLDLVQRLVKQFRGLGKNSEDPRAQGKSHTLINWESGIPDVWALTEARLHDAKGAKRVLRKIRPGMLLIFDLGYWSYAFFKELTDRGVFFVTRLKDHARVETVKRLGPGDWVVRLGTEGVNKTSTLYRLVEVQSPEGEPWRYLTNLMDPKLFSPEEIRALYRERWTIEIFFRDLKHVLDLTSFHGYSLNAIKSQIYAAMITYMLVKILMYESAKRHGLPASRLSVVETVRVLRAWIRTHLTQFWQGWDPGPIHLDELLDLIHEHGCKSLRRPA